jgi:hypothetical protein
VAADLVFCFQTLESEDLKLYFLMNASSKLLRWPRRSKRTAIRFKAAFLWERNLCMLIYVFCCGCASIDGHRSAKPWNEPQEWETTRDWMFRPDTTLTF